MKLFSEIQYKAEERKRQITKSQEVTTYQLPEASQATARCEYILTIPETQEVSIPVVQPTQTATGEPVTVIAKVQLPPRPSSASAQSTSYVVVDDQQPGTSRQTLFTTLLDYPVSLQQFPVCLCSSRWTHHSHFHPLNFNQHCLPLIMNSQDLPVSRVRVSPNQRISLHKSHQTWPFTGPPESSKNN